MAKYRKKPVVIEAMQWPAANEQPEWYKQALASSSFVGRVRENLHVARPHATIWTLEGIHRADPGDWIIQGIKGELYPCKPDIFEATYERVE